MQSHLYQVRLIDVHFVNLVWSSGENFKTNPIPTYVISPLPTIKLISMTLFKIAKPIILCLNIKNVTFIIHIISVLNYNSV